MVRVHTGMMVRVCTAGRRVRDGIFKVAQWSWVFLERTRILRGFQFTTHFFDFFVEGTK